MAKGEVARRRLPLEGADRVVGAMWTDLPRDAIWIAIQDDAHDKLVDNLRETRLPDTPSGHKRLYQHLDFPWPFTNRQWVIDIRDNPVLADATDGASWERTWDLADPALAPAPDPEGIWTPVNDGGWLLVTAGGGTIVVYHVRSVIGGAIPAEVVTRWAMGTLEQMLRHVEKRAQEIPGHYGADHTPIIRPDGSAIPPF
jgi:hypothetical protein